jgi:hypothetical protein
VEALEPLRSRDELRAENRVGVDLDEGEVVRHLRGPEQHGADRERRDQEGADRALQSASPVAGGVGGGRYSASLSSIGGLGRSSSGEPNGYRSVRRKR